MEHREIFKKRPDPGINRQERARDIKTRGKARRNDAHLEHRGLSDDVTISPVNTPVPVLVNRAAVMKSVNKMAGKKNFANKTEERIFKIQQIRERKTRKSPKKRSPFVSVVPVGRIVPKKHDVLEEKMQEFHERREKITKSTTKRRSVGRTIKRKSIGKQRLVVKKQGNKAVVVKAITTGQKSAKKAKVPIIIEPQPSTSSVEPLSLKVKSHSPASNLFVAPMVKPIPKSKVKKETRQSFNVCQSFITSTTTKRVSNVKIIPDSEVPFKDESLLEGISPIQDVTPFKFSASSRSLRNTSHHSSNRLPVPNIPDEQEAENDVNVAKIVGAPSSEPFVFQARKTLSAEKGAKEPVIDDELNVTFTQEEDEDEVVPEGALIVQEEDKTSNKSRQSLRKSLPVIDSPKENVTENASNNKSLPVNKRTEIAKQHTHTLESEIKRLTDRSALWTEIRENMELSENIVGLINSAVGQTTLLINKKFPTFRELIMNYELENGARAVLADDLDGYWYTIMMEVESIDKRFVELEAIKANDWEEVETDDRPKTRTKRGRKKTEKKATVSAGLKDHIRKLRENFKKKEIPDVDPAENLQLKSVKRLADTPRKSIPKRRSLNCSGCMHGTPSSTRKSRSARKMSSLAVTEKPQSAAKSSRKSTKKIMFTEPEMEIPAAVESVAQRSILKSTNKRNTKSVIFAEHSPEKSHRAKKTPRRSRKNQSFDISFDWNDENTPISTYNTPIDTSNITLSRGRQSRKATPLPKVILPLSDAEDSPLSALPESYKRRSTRLFENMV